MVSGVKIKDLVVGAGELATNGKVVFVHTRTFLNRGEECTIAYADVRPTRIQLGKRRAIAGLEYGIEGMRAGGRRELEISPHLGYGEKGIPGSIPPNALLRIEVELVEVREPGILKPEDFPKTKQLIITRPGEAARSVDRWQFGLRENGDFGVSINRYPRSGTTWRHSKPLRKQTRLSEEKANAILTEVVAFAKDHATECVSREKIWADASEKANSIPRDDETNTPCVHIGLYEGVTVVLDLYIPVNSPLLLNAPFYVAAAEFAASGTTALT
jgi:hypothetical protein